MGARCENGCKQICEIKDETAIFCRYFNGANEPLRTEYSTFLGLEDRAKEYGCPYADNVARLAEQAKPPDLFSRDPIGPYYDPKTHSMKNGSDK